MTTLTTMGLLFLLLRNRLSEIKMSTSAAFEELRNQQEIVNDDANVPSVVVKYEFHLQTVQNKMPLMRYLWIKIYQIVCSY